MSEVFEILIAADPSRHAAHIKAEQCAADGATIQGVSKHCSCIRQRIALCGGDGRILQAGEHIDIPDSIHSCRCPMESGQRGSSDLFRGRSVGGQLRIRMNSDEGMLEVFIVGYELAILHSNLERS